MAGGYTPPIIGEFGELINELRMAKRRLDELERPTGTQVADALATLTDLVNGLLTQVNGVFSGYVDAGTTIHSTGRGTFDGGVTSADVRARTITSGYAAAWVDAGGVFGCTTSSVRHKQDIRSVDMSPEVAAMYQAALIEFRYIVDVAENGDLAEWQIGSLAEYFESIGLGRYVFHDIDGLVDGINYERLTIPLIAVVQDLNQRALAQQARIDSLEARLTAAGI